MIGLENIWHIFFNSNNEEVYTKAKDILMKIIKYRYKSSEIFEKFNQFYIEVITENIT